MIKIVTLRTFSLRQRGDFIMVRRFLATFPGLELRFNQAPATSNVEFWVERHPIEVEQRT